MVRAAAASGMAVNVIILALLSPRIRGVIKKIVGYADEMAIKAAIFFKSVRQDEKMATKAATISVR